eukprot:2583369-Pleurochrysis_carterae.AAC.1
MDARGVGITRVRCLARCVACEQTTRIAGGGRVRELRFGPSGWGEAHAADGERHMQRMGRGTGSGWGEAHATDGERHRQQGMRGDGEAPRRPRVRERTRMRGGACVQPGGHSPEQSLALCLRL